MCIKPQEINGKILYYFGGWLCWNIEDEDFKKKRKILLITFMKITLIAFGTSVGGAIIFFILGHNLIQAHLFTIGAGWAIFSMGMAFGLALAPAVLYFEIIIPVLNSKSQIFLLFKTANRKSSKKRAPI